MAFIIGELSRRYRCGAVSHLVHRYKYENTVGGKEEKEAELDDSDPVWVSVRHLHMKDAIDTLMTNFSKFAQEHAGFNG